MGGHVGGVCVGRDQDQGPTPVGIDGGLVVSYKILCRTSTNNKKLWCKLGMKKDVHAV
jgi:hypothetical protein